MKILINDGLDLDAVQYLKDAGFEVLEVQVAQSQLSAYIQEHSIETLLVRSATKVPLEVIEYCPSLRVIARAGVGLDNIDVKAAKKAQIKVLNTPSASAKAVAELAIAHLMGGVRFLHDSNRNMPLEGDLHFKELKKDFSKGRELYAKTLGIVGFGSIGQETAKIAIGLGMKVLYHDPFVENKSISIDFYNGQSIDFNLQNSSKEELLTQSDYISLHLPSQDTYFIGKKELFQMKKGVGIINTARGNVIDEVALINALDEGHVAFAGLDVFESEPKPEIQVLMHPKISLSPHIGGGTLEAQQKIGMDLAKQIITYYKKEKVS